MRYFLQKIMRFIFRESQGDNDAAQESHIIHTIKNFVQKKIARLPDYDDSEKDRKRIAQLIHQVQEDNHILSKTKHILIKGLHQLSHIQPHTLENVTHELLGFEKILHSIPSIKADMHTDDSPSSSHAINIEDIHDTAETLLSIDSAHPEDTTPQMHLHNTAFHAALQGENIDFLSTLVDQNPFIDILETIKKNKMHIMSIHKCAMLSEHHTEYQLRMDNVIKKLNHLIRDIKNTQKKYALIRKEVIQPAFTDMSEEEHIEHVHHMHNILNERKDCIHTLSQKIIQHTKDVPAMALSIIHEITSKKTLPHQGDIEHIQKHSLTDYIRSIFIRSDNTSTQHQENILVHHKEILRNAALCALQLGLYHLRTQQKELITALEKCHTLRSIIQSLEKIHYA